MTAVTPQDFMDDFFREFNAFWASQTTVAWPNKHFDPDVTGPAQDAAYVRPVISNDPDGQRVLSTSVSPQHLTREGSVGVEIFTRGEGSMDQAYQLADDVLRFLERPPRTIIGAVFRRRSLQEIGFNGVWFQVNVTAAFLYFTDRAP